VSRSEVIAGQVELAAARLARAEAVAKAQQALGQLEEALQSPFRETMELGTKEYEHSRRNP